MKIRKAAAKLKSCPFCKCKMGILVEHDGFYKWQGNHDMRCVLWGDYSGAYGCLESLVEEWNKRKNK